MTDSKLLARNTALNLAGFVAPLGAALIAIPWLIHGLGTDRFAVLTLAWAAIGYFGLFDLGLGRALTHAVATRLGSDAEAELDAVAWTALLAMFALGVAGGVALALAAPWLIRDVLKVPGPLSPEATRSFFMLGAALPLVVSTAGLRGIIEAHQHFGLATALRIPLSVSSYLGPLLVLPFTRRLDAVVAVLVAVRVVGCAAHLVLCLRRYAFLRRRVSLHRAVIGPLVRTGGWMTVSNVVNPIMSYFDRFFIGALLPLAAVAYYVTPFEAVMKLTIFPAALVGVLFPAFAESSTHDRAGTAELFATGVRIVVLVLFPAVLAMVTLPSTILHAWVGQEVAQAGSSVLQWLAVGVLVNAVGYVAFVVLQGIGRSDLTGKLNLAELPAYIAAVWFLGRAFGLAGIALAWTLRATVDAIALWLLARRQLPEIRAARSHPPLAAWSVMGAVLVGGAFCSNTSARAAYAVVALAAYVPLAWFALCSAGERSAILHLFRRVLPAVDDPPREAA